MAQFAYIARDVRGQKVSGTLAGATRQMVLAELAARQLAPVKVDAVVDRPTRSISLRERANAYRQLADLLRAGVPLLRGLRVLGKSKAHPKLARVMAKVADAVADGGRLADALAARDGMFPELEIAMIRAGERGGFLEPVLHRLGIFIEIQSDMRSKVIGNLIYPILLIGMGTLVIAGFVFFYVPQFRDFYSRIELPWATKVVLATSDVMREHWLLILLGVAGVGMLIGWLRRQAQVRRAAERWILHVPVLGALRRNLAVARLVRILGTLLGNGVPMLPAMRISRDAAGHVLLAEALDEAAIAVEAGETLTRPLAASGLLGEEVIEMISVGESANNLPDVLITIADTIDKRVDRLLNLLIRLMEPLILVSLGIAVLFLFVALIMPMMQMRGAI